MVAVVAVVAAAGWTGELPEPTWQIVMLVGAVAATASSWFINRNPAAYSLILLVAITYTVITDLDRSYSFEPAMPWSDIVGDLAVVGALAGLIAYSTNKWLGRPSGRDVVEATVVLLGASLATWVLIAEPLIGRGMGIARALAIAAFVPLSVLVASLLINLLNRGLRAHHSLQLASAAAVIFVAGAIAGRVQLVDVWTSAGTTLPTSLYSMAGACILAALAYENFESHLIADPADHVPEQNVRLVLMGTSALVAMTLMAVVPPSGSVDMLIRTVGTVALIALVVIRLAIAQHQHERARESLRIRIDLDELTGLPTRSRLVDLIEESLESSWRAEHQPSVIHLNLDRFKNINDTSRPRHRQRVLVEVA